jgi:hypothetical protein
MAKTIRQLKKVFEKKNYQVLCLGVSGKGDGIADTSREVGLYVCV